MNRINLIIFMVISLITAGCTLTDKKAMQNENEIRSIKIGDNSRLTPSIDNKYEFTYLEALPVDKLEKYNLFLKDGNTNHLIDFMPKQIVLICMNLVLKHDVDKIYALTYNNGQLPSLDIFTIEYDKYLSPHLEEDYLKYRFYDSITVDEETRKPEELTVLIKISYGNTTQSVAYGLKKDGDVWKMGLYHLVEDAKKGNKNS